MDAKRQTQRQTAQPSAEQSAAGARQEQTYFEDRRPETLAQRKWQDLMSASPQVQQAMQRKAMMDDSCRQDPARERQALVQRSAVQAVAGPWRAAGITASKSEAGATQSAGHSRAPTVMQNRAAAMPVVQRQLRQSKNRSGDLEKIEAGDLGATGFLLHYAMRLSEDTAALVDGKTNTKKAGVIAALKEGELDGAAFSEKLTETILAYRQWADAEESDIKAFANFMRKENREDEVEDEDAADAIDYLNPLIFRDKDTSEKWVAKRLGVEDASTVGAALEKGSAIPDAWSDTFIDTLYEMTKTNWYAEDFVPFVPPFKKLIDDVNEAEIEEFRYVEKYGAGANRGAEFTVEAPDDKKTFYANKAVLHTHYPNGTSALNYAHTKPYDRRKASGYGYTKVTLANVTGIDDTQKTFNAL